MFIRRGWFASILIGLGAWLQGRPAFIFPGRADSTTIVSAVRTLDGRLRDVVTIEFAHADRVGHSWSVGHSKP